MAKLLPYQAAWVRDATPLKICEKSRRIGMSWTEAYDAVMHAGTRRTKGNGGNVYYQSYAKDMTSGFIGDCGAWAERLQIAAGKADELLLDLAGKPHPAFRLPLSSGNEIVAMTSAPRAFRSKGRPGDRAIVDEAAFVDDLGEVLKSALAFRIWGGEVRVLSTHNGDGNPFAALVADVRDGKRPGSLHTITFANAIADGLHDRIREVDPTATPDATAWEAEIRSEYGAQASEELDCVPSAGGGAWLGWADIRRCEHPDAGDPAQAGRGRTHLAVDVARRGDLWVLVALEEVGDVLWVRDLTVRRNITFAEQRAIVRNAIERHRPAVIAVDQTGMGEAFVEQLCDEHGSIVQGVLLTAPRRLDCAVALRERCEDGKIRFPVDEALRADLHAVKREAGAAGAAPRLVVADAVDGHADRFWALAIGADSFPRRHQRFGYRAVAADGAPAGRSQWRERPDHSADYVGRASRPLAGRMGGRAGTI